MATVNKIDTTFTGKDIHTALSVYEFTADGTYKVRFQIQLTSLAGGGDYSVWATLNDGDAVGDYVIHPKTTITLAAGAQSIWIVSGEIDVMSGDVVNIFALGLAGDTSVAGIVRVFSDDATAVATLADDAITASKFDESTAFPVKSADTGATAIARVGAGSDTLETLSDQIDGVKTKTDQLTFTTPNKVDASATIDPTGLATSADLAVVDANVDAIKVKTDALDVSDITVVATVDGSTLTILRGDTWDDAHLLNLCDLTDYVSIDFVVKESKADTDDDAIIHIRKNASGTGDGLLRLNKAAYATATDGAVTIEDIPTGDITPTLKATATKDLVPGSYIYDIQVITATSVKTRTSGVLKVMSDVTRLIA